MRNRIVTRGFGTNQLICSRGYGGAFVERIVEIVQRIIITRGGRKPHSDYEEVRVWAKMIEFDDHEPSRPIEGSVSVRVKKGERTKFIATLVAKKLKDWAVSVLRVIR